MQDLETRDYLKEAVLLLLLLNFTQIQTKKVQRTKEQITRKKLGGTRR